MSELLERSQYCVERARTLGADDVIAISVRSQARQVRYSENQIDISQQWNESVTSVFLAKDRRIVSTEIRNFATADAAIDGLVKLARASQENPDYAGIAEGRFHYPTIRTDPKLKEPRDLSRYVRSAIDAALDEGAVRAGGVLQTRNEQVGLASSGGPAATDDRTAIELSIRAFADGDASGHGVECAARLSQFHPERAGQKAGEIAVAARDPVDGSEGRSDVIFDPLFFGSVLGTFSSMASAFYVLAGLSMYDKKVGKRVASEAVTLVDDASQPSLAARRFDDEGVPTRRTVIIRDGVLKTLLHNTTTAAKFRTKTTGHAGWIAPSPFCPTLVGGTHTKEELFEEVRDGLYLTNTWYTRFHNYYTGDFSTIPRDGIFRIRRGELDGSVKNIRVSDNLLRLCKRIAAISKERQQVHWWAEADPPSFSPYVLARKIQITKSAM